MSDKFNAQEIYDAIRNEMHNKLILWEMAAYQKPDDHLKDLLKIIGYGEENIKKVALYEAEILKFGECCITCSNLRVDDYCIDCEGFLHRPQMTKSCGLSYKPRYTKEDFK